MVYDIILCSEKGMASYKGFWKDGAEDTGFHTKHTTLYCELLFLSAKYYFAIRRITLHGDLLFISRAHCLLVRGATLQSEVLQCTTKYNFVQRSIACHDEGVLLHTTTIFFIFYDGLLCTTKHYVVLQRLSLYNKAHQLVSTTKCCFVPRITSSYKVLPCAEKFYIGLRSTTFCHKKFLCAAEP